MNKRIVFLSGVLLFALAMLLSAQSALAATGCFPDTNGHWAETFICWLKDNGITSGYSNGNYGPEDYVTRAQMAVFLQKAAEIPPSTGQILVNVGLGEWKNHYINGNPLSFSYDTAFVGISNTMAGTYYLTATPTQPLAQYGRSLALSGMELCYLAPTATIKSIRLTKITQINNFTSSYDTFLIDNTTRNDSQCVYFSFTPVQLDPDSFINIVISGDWVSSSSLVIGRTLLVYAPTTINAPVPVTP